MSRRFTASLKALRKYYNRVISNPNPTIPHTLSFLLISAPLSNSSFTTSDSPTLQATIKAVTPSYHMLVLMVVV